MSVWFVWISFAVLIGATAALALRLRVVDEAVREAAVQVDRLALARTEMAALARGRARLADLQRRAEAAIDDTTAGVRAVHKGIASIPFSILEGIPATRDAARLVRGIHDVTTDQVYAAASAVNKAVGRRVRKPLGDAGETE